MTSTPAAVRDRPAGDGEDRQRPTDPRTRRFRSLLAALCVVVAVASAYLVGNIRPPDSHTTAELFLPVPRVAPGTAADGQAVLRNRELLASYTQLVHSPQVLARARGALAPQPPLLSRQINSYPALDGTLLSVTVDDPSPARAGDAVRAVADALVAVVDQSPPASAEAPPKLSVVRVEDASGDAAPILGRTALAAVITAVLAMLLIDLSSAGFRRRKTSGRSI